MTLGTNFITIQQHARSGHSGHRQKLTPLASRMIANASEGWHWRLSSQ
jgi:hypothetical protein